MAVDLDGDLTELGWYGLLKEARRLREAIRKHRDASGHNLCWYHPELWALLPDTPKPMQVPSWPSFLLGCIRYRRSL